MTFSCPNLDENDARCRLLKVPCVPGRDGCIQDDAGTYAEDLATRIRRADEVDRLRSNRHRDRRR